MPPAATRMELETLTLREVSQPEKDKWCHLHMESETRYKGAYLQNRNRLTVFQTNLRAVLLWRSGLRTWRCHCSGLGHYCGVSSMPGLETSTGRGQERKKERNLWLPKGQGKRRTNQQLGISICKLLNVR